MQVFLLMGNKHIPDIGCLEKDPPSRILIMTQPPEQRTVDKSPGYS